MANYAWTTLKPLPTVSNGQVIEYWNLCQKLPHTKIFDGVTGLTFKSCNLVNCDVPPDAIIIDCNGGHMELCGNANPKLVERGILDACIPNCSHVVDTDTITIDGITVDTVYHYSNKTVS